MGRVKHRFYEFACYRVLVQRYNGISYSPGSTHASSELNKELCSGFVNFIHENGKILKHLLDFARAIYPKRYPAAGQCRE